MAGFICRWGQFDAYFGITRQTHWSCHISLNTLHFDNLILQEVLNRGMKKKSRKLKSYLHGELIESSFNELELLKSRPSTNPKLQLLQVLDSLSHKLPPKK